MTPKEILRAASDQAFWRAQAPGLHVGEPLSSSLPAAAPRIGPEGWIRIEAVLPRAECDALAAGVRCLHDSSIPTPFIYVFDEAWSVASRLAPTFDALVGSRARALPDVWAWYITEGHGWSPHRGVTERGTSLVNVWVALSDVSEDSACMHVVPLDRDPHVPNDLARIDVDPSLAVALPAPAGSVLAWNANVLHWGGEMKRGAPPRVSMSFTIEPGEPSTPPTFEERVDLLADMLLTYRHVEGPWLEWASLWAGMRR